MLLHIVQFKSTLLSAWVLASRFNIGRHAVSPVHDFELQKPVQCLFSHNELCCYQEKEKKDKRKLAHNHHSQPSELTFIIETVS